ncbi:hypothetical protein QOT17_004061 [Balamuthia mandrillaris]
MASSSSAPPPPFILAPDESVAAPVTHIGHDRVVYKHLSEAFDVLELTIPPRSSPPMHLHEHQTETLHLLAGTLAIKSGNEGEERLIGAGTTLVLPPGCPHTYVNRTEQPAKLLAFICPGGSRSVTTFFREAGTPEPEPIDPSKIMQKAQDNGVIVVGPPLAAE